MTMSDARTAAHSLKRALTWKQVPNSDLVDTVVKMADKAPAVYAERSALERAVLALIVVLIAKELRTAGR